MLGGYAIGASKGYVYVRAEYPIAVERLGNAIDQARKAGILGENVMGSGFSFDLEIRIGAGAFVCGEETSLLASIEGKRGEPRQKPPFPFEKGLFESPTIINNVETLANAAPIILNGSQCTGDSARKRARAQRYLPWREILSMQVLSRFPWVRFWEISYTRLAAESLGAKNSRPFSPAVPPADV